MQGLASNFNLNSQLAIDPQSVGQLRGSAAKDPKAANHQVAQQFEALFMNMMLKAMRSATPHYDSLETSTTDTWTSMHDQQLLQGMTQRGIGFAAMIEKQLNLITDPSLRQVPLIRPPSCLPGQTSAAKAASVSANSAAEGTETPEQFVAEVGQHAATAAESLGVSPHLIVAHAALESGWGKRPIRDQKGNNSFNLFGIKAGSDWTGKTADVTTTEYVGGVAQKRVERFRAYDSYDQAFADYASLVQTRFSSATQSGSNGDRFAANLQKSGYATDPQYAKKLAQVAANPALNVWRAA